ncbi:signal transducer and activator of transcription A-like [Gossypium australe]|uniref:Signal transducer and activator of transcription A-like n=1 Tax=Gossypium australe TaxID=47621 RepID=A0A5B6VNW9_9ROSI|nr:signal transducer and activator of transcription A-like [Gossypium australe]
MLMNKLPPMLKAPKSFTIPCSIGNHYVGKALCDLGERLNIMPMFILRKIGIGKARPIIVTLQLVDCSAHPKASIILGRHFLATTRTLIDVQKGELTMKVNDQQITFNVFYAMKCAEENEECHAIGFLDSSIEEEFASFFHNNSDDDGDPLKLTEVKITGELGELIETKQFEHRQGRSFKSLDLSNRSFKPPRPSIKDPPSLELKPLPLHLKYAYLGDNNTLPIVISIELTPEQ